MGVNIYLNLSKIILIHLHFAPLCYANNSTIVSIKYNISLDFCSGNRYNRSL